MHPRHLLCFAPSISFLFARSARIALALIFSFAYAQAAQPARIPDHPHATTADERSLLQALTKTVDGDVVIGHPEDLSSNGDGSAFDRFGAAVALSVDTAIVGASQDDNAAGMGAGSAYVYTRSNGVWQQQAKLIPANGSDGAYFGWSVAIKGDTVLVGAARANKSGAVYVFQRTGTQWAQQAVLVAADGEAEDYFGWSVALDTNMGSDIALIGAALDDTSAGVDAGSAHVFVRSGSVWSQQAQLLPNDAAAGAGFGLAVALSGANALIGAPFDDTLAGTQAGSAYVFTSSLSTWSQTAKINAYNGASHDQFGNAVALLGDRALIGAWADDTEVGADSGSAQVFKRNAGLWQLSALLTPSDAAANDFFGVSVALSADTFLVGAFSDNTSAGSDAGSAYVFRPISGVGLIERRLQPNDAAAADNFAGSVALYGDTVLAGSSLDYTAAGPEAGSATLFTRSSNNWNQQAQLSTGVGHATDGFGAAIVINGDTALISTQRLSGSTYVFVRSANTWQLQAKLSSPDAQLYSLFGSSLALSGDTALIGAPLASHPGALQQGEVYVFVRSAGVWSQQARLVAPATSSNALFGRAVALSGNTALIGAPDDSAQAFRAGSVYVYTRSGTAWTQQSRLNAASPHEADEFGTAVAMSGDTALISAPFFDTESVENVGAVWVYQRNGNAWNTQAQLFGTNVASNAGFGRSVALFNDTALIGAPLDNTANGIATGSAYVYTKTAATWNQQAKLIATNAAPYDRFGWQVALAGDSALIGSFVGKPTPGSEAGFAYLYARNQGIWTQQPRLRPNAGALNDTFGMSVALSTDTALIGSPGTDSAITDSYDVGAVYVYATELLFSNGFED